MPGEGDEVGALLRDCIRLPGLCALPSAVVVMALSMMDDVYVGTRSDE